MKTIITVFVISVLILIGCTQESTKDTTIKGEQDCQFVDPVNDLVAFLDPVQEKLFVLPDHKDSVIKMLGAEPLDDEMYTMNAVTVSKRNIQMNFTISVLNSPSQIFFYVDIVNLSNANYYANRDTGRGVYLRTFKDSTGTFYRVYKDAECKKVRDTSSTDCKSEKIWVYIGTDPYDSVGNYILKETGNYIKTEYDEIYNCLKGDKYCVEAYVITERKYICNDSKCKHAIRIDPWYDYSCIK